jgi:hypothetical protein
MGSQFSIPSFRLEFRRDFNVFAQRWLGVGRLAVLTC